MKIDRCQPVELGQKGGALKGTVFSIEEFSVYDGPGIRTSVFLKGCPLRCTWCHNPEGQELGPQIVRSPNGCIGCNECVRTAQRDANGVLSFTDEGIKKCPMHLLRVCGEELECDALCERLLKNQKILNMGGGVTFSGGEPLMQSEFLFACMERLKGKLHLAIQTSGFCAEEVFFRALMLADYFLYDLKLIDNGMHRCYTGVSNECILKNFSALAKSGVPFTARVPLIPTVTDTKENLGAIAEVLSSHGIHYVELLPYNKMAGGKYKMVLLEYRPRFDESIPVQSGEEIFSAYGIETKIL